MLNITRICIVSIDGLVMACFWWSVLLDFLWWTHWLRSYLFFYVGMLLHIGVLFMVLFSSFFVEV
jgi:hypothetical protein